MFERIIIKQLNTAEELYKEKNFKKAYKIFWDNCSKLPSSAFEAIMAKYYIAEMHYNKLITDSSYRTAEEFYWAALQLLKQYYPQNQLIDDIELKYAVSAYQNGKSEEASLYLKGRSESVATEILNAISEEKHKKELKLQQEENDIRKSEDVKWLKEKGRIYEEEKKYLFSRICYERAAELKDGNAMVILAINYIRGFYGKDDIKKAIEYIKDAAQTDERDTALKLLNFCGESPEKLSSRELSFDERRLCLQTSVELGEELSLIRLGGLYISKAKIDGTQKQSTKHTEQMYKDIALAYTYFLTASKSSNQQVSELGLTYAKSVEDTVNQLAKEFDVPFTEVINI